MDVVPASRARKRRARHALLPTLLALMLLAAACGSSESGASGLATLEDVAHADDGVAASDDTPDGATLQADEAALEFSQCMRDEGLDFPDIGVDAEGNPELRESFQAAGLDPRSAEFRDAMDECADLLDGAGFGGGRRALADDPAVQDAFVEYSECLRDNGLDVGDLQLGGPPAGDDGDGQPDQTGDGSDPQRGQGQGQGGFGNRSNRIADALGLDPEDPEVAAALDMCGPILDSAFSGFGPGAAEDG